MNNSPLWIATAAMLGFHQLGSATDLGVLNAIPEVQILEILAPNVTFSTQYMFTVVDNSSVSAGATNLWVQLDNTTVLGILDFKLTLHDASNQLLATAISRNDSFSIDAYALSPNPYYFEVSGSTAGTSGGFYSFAAIARALLTPVPVVPEPASIGMLALGLTAIGWRRLRMNATHNAGVTA